MTDNGVIICRKDINGKIIVPGDIVAEGIVGELIWDGMAKLIERPIGIVIGSKDPRLTQFSDPEESNFYNVQEIRAGIVQLMPNAKEFLKKNADSSGAMHIYLSRYDGVFYNWNKVEIISSIYDFPA